MGGCGLVSDSRRPCLAREGHGSLSRVGRDSGFAMMVEVQARRRHGAELFHPKQVSNCVCRARA